MASPGFKSNEVVFSLYFLDNLKSVFSNLLDFGA